MSKWIAELEKVEKFIHENDQWDAHTLFLINFFELNYPLPALNN
jgi:hypothetical protein